MAEAGIKINGKHYEIPTSLRVGETRTIKRLTGLNPPEFMLALASLKDTQDPDVGAAMVWWIVHREDSSFTIEQVDDLEWGAIEGDGEDGQVDVVDPKGNGARSASSLTSADASSNSPDAPGETTPANGGAPDLVPYGHAT